VAAVAIPGTWRLISHTDTDDVVFTLKIPPSLDVVVEIGFPQGVDVNLSSVSAGRSLGLAIHQQVGFAAAADTCDGLDLFCIPKDNGFIQTQISLFQFMCINYLSQLILPPV
jgi:hypothetical protein